MPPNSRYEATESIFLEGGTSRASTVMTLTYRKWKVVVSLMSVMNVPLGVFIGWMMALGNVWFVGGIAALMFFDWYGSQAWLKAIEQANGSFLRRSVVNIAGDPAGEEFVNPSISQPSRTFIASSQSHNVQITWVIRSC